MTFIENETIVAKINILSRFIIYHSILYYNLSDSIISDFAFDRNAKQLYKLMIDNPSHFLKSKFYYVMKDFNGNSGFGLCEHLTENDKKYFLKIINLGGMKALNTCWKKIEKQI